MHRQVQFAIDSINHEFAQQRNLLRLIDGLVDFYHSSLSPVRQTFIITAIAVLMSFTFTALIYLLLAGMDDKFWLVINIALLVPLAISIPLGFHLSRQRFQLFGLTQRLQEARKELEQVNKALHQRANFDGLTGLPTRESFFEQLDELFDDPRPNVLMIVDVDHFKTINDSYGHPVGDQALIILSKMFGKILRKDDLVGRLGGEEFGIILPDTGPAEGHIIGEMIRHEIESIIFEPHENLRHVITVSIGVTDMAVHQDRSLLMTYADAALFTAKRNGRNQVVTYQPGMRAKLRPVGNPDGQPKPEGYQANLH